MSQRTSAPWLLAVTVVLTAFNLRTAVTSLGALLREVQAGVGMSATVAGVLTTLPLVSFGVVGILAARVGRRFGTERTLVAALAFLVAGLLLRAGAPAPLPLLVASAVALVGAALANVLVPVAVKRWFPDHVGRVTGWYTFAITIGAAVPAATAVPIATALGGWRVGLAFWALPALVALLPWAWVLRHRALAIRGGAPLAVPELHVPVHRHPRAWALAVFFGLQSLEAYVVMGWLPTIFQDAGVSAATAGVLLAISVGLGAPIAILLPEVAARRADQRVWVVAVVAASFVGYLGLIAAPTMAPVVWSSLLGVGLGAFPLALVLIGLRAATPAGTASLSALAQGSGYLIAVLGPFTVGALRDLTGGWRLPLWVLVGLLVPKFAAGWFAAKPGHIDTEVVRLG